MYFGKCIRIFDSQPFAVVIATVRMVGELVFVRRYVNATVDGQNQTVLHVRLHSYHITVTFARL